MLEDIKSDTLKKYLGSSSRQKHFITFSSHTLSFELPQYNEGTDFEEGGQGSKAYLFGGGGGGAYGPTCNCIGNSKLDDEANRFTRYTATLRMH